MPFTRIGKYWNRKGDVDIDVMILNDNSREAYIFEVKMDRRKITTKVMKGLFEKAVKIPELQGYKINLGKAFLTANGLKIEM